MARLWMGRDIDHTHFLDELQNRLKYTTSFYPPQVFLDGTGNTNLGKTHDNQLLFH